MAIMLVVVIAFAGLALDAGMYYKRLDAMQSVADGAALSGAAVLPLNQAVARDRARTIVQANGMDPLDFTIQTDYQNQPDELLVFGARRMDTLFMRIVGVNTVPVAVRAVARRSPPRAFDFAIFSGSETQPLELSGNNTVDGGTHGNADVLINGSNQLGAVEAVGSVGLTGSNHTGDITDHAGSLPLPNIDYATLAQGATTVYSGNQTLSGTWPDGIIIVHGNLTLNGDLSFTGTLLVDGNVTITGNATHITAGQVAIVARGDITILGNAHLTYDQPRSSGGTSSLALVSTGGNILVGGNAEIDGIVYAPSTGPGTGMVSLQGNAEIDGAVIGNQVASNGNVEVDYDHGALTAVPPTTRDRARLIQ